MKTVSLQEFKNLNKPKKKNKTPEYDEQCAFFWWLDSNKHIHPAFKWVHAIPNGLRLSILVAKKAKAQGVKSGVWDTLSNHKMKKNDKVYSGLYIEFKSKNGKLQESQKEFQSYVESQDYMTKIAYSCGEAAKILMDYLDIDENCVKMPTLKDYFEWKLLNKAAIIANRKKKVSNKELKTIKLR